MAQKVMPGGSTAEPLKYVVSMQRAKAHYFDVSLSVALRRPSEGPVTFEMPVWTPGHYVIEDFPRNVVDIEAVSEGSGERLALTKETKNTWKVAWGGRSIRGVRLDYSVYAFNYSDTASYLDALHAIINGASLFIYPAGMEKERVRVRLVPPSNWGKAVSGLEQVSPFEFVAPDIDTLIDSPIEIGDLDVRSFIVRGVEHQVSMFGKSNVGRYEFVEDIRKIVESEVQIFGDVPYGRYVFLVNFTEEVGGGLEHMNSTMCFVPRLKLVPREEYNTTMGLLSHEYFHAWNVKRLRPKELGPFNYSAEVYTKSLWVAEGITSYYDDLVLRRAGIYSVPEYLDAFALNINLMKSYPGSRKQSAEEASFDAWIKFYKTDPNSPNVTMSYYTQGAIIGWMLDMKIRKNTGSRKSLDSVMKKMYKETYLKSGRGYTDEEFEAAALEVGGADLKEVFDSRVRGREDVDFERYLGYAGLKLEPKVDLSKPKGFLGVRISNEGGRTLIKTKLAGSPAEEMGLAVGDELIGLDGLRLAGERLPFYIATTKPGTEVRVEFARNGVLMEVKGMLGSTPTFEHRIVPLGDAKDEQKSFFKAWLLEDWSPSIKYPEYTRSPERKTPFDFV